MKKRLLIISLLTIGFVTVLVAGACTRCDCTGWVQKSKFHGSAGEPHAYCKCEHFWENH